MNKMHVVRKRNISKYSRLGGSILLWILILASLPACSSLIVQSNAVIPGPTPTVYAGFAPANHNSDNNDQSSVGLPAVSDLFSNSQSDVTSILSPTQVARTQAIELTSPTSIGTIQPTLTSPSNSSEPIPTIQEIPLITSAPTLSGDLSVGKESEDALTGASQFKYVYIYRDSLTSGWQAFDSWNMYYSLGEKQTVHTGRFAINATPAEDYGGLFFNLSQASPKTYLRDKVAGVSFWINPGDKSMDPNHLAVTVLGSNKFPYWVYWDESVEIDNEQKFFSETRLSLLDFHHDLQPNTWYQVLLWLDDLPFDPDYKYLTGFYIKNDVGFRNTFYIDDVSLIINAK